MKTVKIITDSNSGISQAEAEKLGIIVIPMPFTINDQEYLEEISISQQQFYEFLSQDAEVKTSQPSKFYLEELWKKTLKTCDEIVYIPISSGLSATCENAKIYAQKFEGKVQVVDNLRISVTQKESVMQAIKLVSEGKDAVAVRAQLERTKDVASIYIMLSVLKYLKKGGRISPTAAALGDMFKLKPILYSRGGSFEKFAVAFSLGQAKQKMLAQIETELNSEFKNYYESGHMAVSVAHTCNAFEAEKFKEEIIAKFPKLKFHYVDALSLSVSCHIGPGSLAVALALCD